MTASTLDLVKQGNPVAFAAMVNKSLAGKGITVRATSNKNHLTIFVEYQTPPQRNALVNFLKNSIIQLKLTQISRVTIRGSAIGQTVDAWQEQFEIRFSEPQSALVPTETSIANALVPALQNFSDYSPSPDRAAQSPVDALGFGVLVFLLVVNAGFMFGTASWSFNHEVPLNVGSRCVLVK